MSCDSLLLFLSSGVTEGDRTSTSYEMSAKEGIQLSRPSVYLRTSHDARLHSPLVQYIASVGHAASNTPRTALRI